MTDETINGAASQALRALGVRSVRLLTNNPEKVSKLEALGITVVEAVTHQVPARTEAGGE